MLAKVSTGCTFSGKKKEKDFLVDIVQNVLLRRRVGRAVDCGSLENC